MELFEQDIKKMLKSYSEITLEVPPDEKMGDYAFPCFQLSSKLKKSPVEIAKEIAEKLHPTRFIEHISAAGPYVNFFINKRILAEYTLTEIFRKKKRYGSKNKNSKMIVIDMSSPNIAKPFGIGHLRSTVIGNSLAKMFLFSGYDVHCVNHLGDWGTQFGKLIVAYKKWGVEKELEIHPIKHLLDLYVRFHKEAESDESLNEQGRQWFKKLEDKDPEATKLWELFREMSLVEFNNLYKLIDVEFDSYHGESYYNDKMQDVIDSFKPIAKESDGALVVELDDTPPLLLKKSDGATTYHTRDLAAAIYRLKEYSPEKVLYVVGTPQQLHFKQLFKALELNSFPADKFVHVNFGLIRFPEGKMSTRKGNIVLLEEVLDKSIELALKTIYEKNPGLENKKEVAKQVGIGAVKFGDLANDRIKDITFDWNKILDFEGETAPYIQYVHARCCSILSKSEVGPSDSIQWDSYEHESEFKLIKLLQKFPQSIEQSLKNYKPHILANYLSSLAQVYNEFYQHCPVISEMKHIQKARILLVDSVRQIIETGLGLLGIQAPEKM